MEVVKKDMQTGKFSDAIKSELSEEEIQSTQFTIEQYEESKANLSALNLQVLAEVESDITLAPEFDRQGQLIKTEDGETSMHPALVGDPMFMGKITATVISTGAKVPEEIQPGMKFVITQPNSTDIIQSGTIVHWANEDQTKMKALLQLNYTMLLVRVNS